MPLTNLSNEDLKNLKGVVNEGVKINQEISDLKEGLKDTVKNLSKDLDIPVKTINRAIQIKFKDSLEDDKEAVSEIEELLDRLDKV